MQHGMQSDTVMCGPGKRGRWLELLLVDWTRPSNKLQWRFLHMSS